MTKEELQQYLDEANVSISSNGIIVQNRQTRVDTCIVGRNGSMKELR